MTTYNTYQEAKVANPKGDIYKLDRQEYFVCSEHGGVEVVMFTDYDSIGVKCSHEDYCVTIENDWRDEVVNSLPAGYGVEAFCGKDIRIKGIFDKEQALILANAIITSLTEKPTDG